MPLDRKLRSPRSNNPFSLNLCTVSKCSLVRYCISSKTKHRNDNKYKNTTWELENLKIEVSKIPLRLDIHFLYSISKSMTSHFTFHQMRHVRNAGACQYIFRALPVYSKSLNSKICTVGYSLKCTGCRNRHQSLVSVSVKKSGLFTFQCYDKV